MTEHHPETAKVMGVASVGKDDYRPVRSVITPDIANEASRLANQLLMQFQSVSDPKQRGIIIGEVRDLLRRMEDSRGWIEPSPPDF